MTEIDAEAAKIAIENDRKARIEACAKELDEVCKKHKCVIEPSMIIKGGQHPQLQINVLSSI